MIFRPYDETIEVPNIVVDGSPNLSTVLTLSHWPGIAAPPALVADTSAEMAFGYLDGPVDHEPAAAVTNNHFDQDGLVGIYALTEPESAQRNRDLLIDVARAGDFATYRHRAAARASMTLWAYAQPDRSPIGAQLGGPYLEQCALLYAETLRLVIEMVQSPERFRELWGAEDASLTEAENAIRDGRVMIVEHDLLDMAVLTVPEQSRLGGGHRFAAGGVEMIHPMAVHNATDCCRLLLCQGRTYRYMDRYETWVQYTSRQLPRRVDLVPLADRLTELETGLVQWNAKSPGSLTPELSHDGESALDLDVVRRVIAEHLGTAAPAWNPFVT